MKHKVLILGTLGEFTELVKKAKEKGYETVVCDGYADGIARTYADKAYTIPVTDVDAIALMCREEGVDGIITSFSDLLLECMVKIADKAGIARDKIILDPGVGFGKTYEMNLETMNHLELFQHLGFPVLLGTSRKSMIGLALDLPVDQRVEGTVATSVIGVMKGCAFVRVHDIKENKRAILMTEAILGRNIK